MSIPLQTKLEFLENVVILSFGDPEAQAKSNSIDSLFSVISHMAFLLS
jgi:hypothetical protein